MRYKSAKGGAIFIQRAVSIRTLAIRADARPVVAGIPSSVTLYHGSVLAQVGRTVTSSVHCMYSKKFRGPVYRWVLLVAEKLRKSALGK